MFGPNAAGKTTLLEAVVLLALGRSHRTSVDAELISWGAEVLRVEGVVGSVEEGASAPADSSWPNGAHALTAARPGTLLELTVQAGGRKRIQVNGVPRRAAALAEHLRTVLFAPEEMMLVMGAPGLRRVALDVLTGPHDRAYGSHMATYARALQQRNSLLRSIREGQASRDDLRLWDEPFLAAGSAIVASRRRVLAEIAAPLASAHSGIAPGEGTLTVEYASNVAPVPGEGPREALARRLSESAEKEIWNGATLVGPHRDDLVFRLDGRDLASFASRGQQRTAILSLKLAELDLLTALDGRPPLLLLDDVFSELDPDRRAHLVRRVAGLPQALITATHPEDVDRPLRRKARSWRVVPGPDGARVVEEDEA